MNISSNLDATHDAQVYNNQLPSYNSDMGREGNSLNQFQNVSACRDLGQTDTPKNQSLIALERERNSHAYGRITPILLGGVEHHGSSTTPNLSDANRREASHTGDSSMVIEGSDVQDYLGMSLVRKNFRRFYPNAYYKEKDGDN
nr:hypothetical protein [Tanacetum cinerariifolium]